MKKLLISLLLIPGIAFAETGFQNEALATKYATAGTAGPVAMNKYGQAMCSLNSGIAAVTNPVRLEDSAHVTGHALMGVAGVMNVNMDVAAATQDYTYLATGAYGQSLSTLVYESSGAVQALSPIRTEDTVFAASQPVMMSGAQAVSAVAQTVGTSGDIAPPSMDLGNRLITTMAPAGETWQACSATIASTASNAIKAAVASNRIYVTALSCTNKSAVASEISFYDGGSFIDTGWLPATASFSRTYPVPLRGTVNTAFNLQLTTVSTSTICCASGYISTI